MGGYGSSCAGGIGEGGAANAASEPRLSSASSSARAVMGLIWRERHVGPQTFVWDRHWPGTERGELKSVCSTTTCKLENSCRQERAPRNAIGARVSHTVCVV